MFFSYEHPNADRQYFSLINDILENNTEKGDRTGTGTHSVFGREIKIDRIDHRFPLLTTKRMAWKQIVTELLWFLKGKTNIKWLVDRGNYIWVGDAYKHYRLKGKISSSASTKTFKNNNPLEGLIDNVKDFKEKIKNDEEFARTWGDLGPVYGKQWRDWNGVDQMRNLIDQLKTNPDSRRLMVNAWNVEELPKMKLPPCHYNFQVYTHNGHISMIWNQRSVDVGLGLPFNIASYALLLKLIAREVDLVPHTLIGYLGDTHIYKNHVNKLKEQLTRDPEHYDEPRVYIRNQEDSMFDLEYEDFSIEDYQSYEKINLPLSN